MSSKRTSLASLVGQVGAKPDAPAVPRPAAPAPVGGTVRLPLDRLANNPHNPRLTVRAVEEMADSLRERGVIQPLTVVTRKAFLAAHPGDGAAIGDAAYVVLDGNRRYMGARQAGLADVPVHVDDDLAADSDSILENALVAAVQHEALDPLDEARALQRLVEVHGSQRQVAKRLGKSNGFVSQRLTLLELTPELQQAVEEKAIPVEVARKVGRLAPEAQADAVRQELESRAQVPPKRPRASTDTPPVEPSEPEAVYAVNTPGETGGAAEGEVPAPRPEPAQGVYGVNTSTAAPSRDAAGPVMAPLLPGAPAEHNADVLMRALPPRELVAVIDVMLERMRAS
ncbi:ParB/RepB/Spo0J family partition protein [Streptomyces sp. NPDC001380]|uniref:ParB/RepB/Spo0J family partition protein n=1 Tax=Streptomyces sp. NPDC001380 TaxID=3364566 RepID=UPI0036A8A1D9